MIYTTEKSLKELGNKVDAATRTNIEGTIERLKKAMEGTDADEIKRMTDELMQNSHKLAETMYSQAAGGQETGTQAEGEPSKKEDVVDADFEEVKDEKK